MSYSFYLSLNLSLASFAFCTTISLAQVPVTPHKSPESLLVSGDAITATNKRLVYDFYRIVVRGGQLDQVDRFLSDSYIQHNPNVPTGKDGFVKFFKSKRGKQTKRNSVPKALDDLVAIIAEQDIVTAAFVANRQEMDLNYTTTWFDMFRIKEGKIVEHWDNSLRSHP